MNIREEQDLETAKQTPLKTNPRPIILIALIGLGIAFGLFLLWALLAPLDEGVVAHGEITVGTHKKAIQHQYGGTIKEILVAEGSRVKKGQVLIRLNEVQPKANLANVRSEYFAALALEARLQTERNKASEIIFPEELTSMSRLPEITDHMRTQQELFNARRRTLQSELNILRENIDGMLDYIKRLEELQISRAKQMELLNIEMAALRKLADQGYYPRAKLLEMERVLADLSGKRSEDLGNIIRSKMTMGEYRTTMVRRQQEFLQDVETKLSEVQKKLAALKDQYVASFDVFEKTEIKAPEAGTVVGLTVHTTGGVVMPGDTIMYVVPKNDELIVEVRVMTADRDRIQERLKVNVMFPAFDIKKTPVIDGEVVLISADRFTDEVTRMPYYHCRIKLTPEGLRQLGNRDLQPGMPVQAVIITGERTLANYLVKPLFDRIAISFKER
jgi:HlyD family type I secretion membrane fusion protein